MTVILRIGLTGGIGSGKSTVAKLLSDLDARIIDADAISRDLTNTGGQAIPFITESFGASFIDCDGSLKREKMRSLIFTNANERSKLERIIHPLVRNIIQTQTNQAMADNCKVIVYDVPLFVESSHWREQVDHLIVIDTTPEIQIHRVMARSEMSAVQVEKIIASQTTRHARLRAADTVLSNITVSLHQLASEVQYLAKRFGLSCL